MDKERLEKNLRRFERQLKALAREKGVALEASRGERMVVLKPKEEPDFFFPPFVLLEKNGLLFLAALLPEEVQRRGPVEGETLPLAVLDLEVEGKTFPAAAVGLFEVPTGTLFEAVVSELALASLRLVLEAKDALEEGLQA